MSVLYVYMYICIQLYVMMCTCISNKNMYVYVYMYTIYIYSYIWTFACNMDQYGTMATVNCVVQKCSGHPQWILVTSSYFPPCRYPRILSFNMVLHPFPLKSPFQGICQSRYRQSHISLVYPIGVAE